jgi:hypothetical protein
MTWQCGCDTRQRKRSGKMPTGVYKRTPEILVNIRAAANRPEMRVARSARMIGDKNPLWGKTGDKHPMYGRTGEKNPWWGKHHTPEAKAKNRAAHMGNKNGKGHVVSAEARAKIRAARIGKKALPETIAKMSGFNSPHWRGGISREPYAWTFNAELKEEVRRRDGYKCQLCGVPQAECNRALDVHHIDYDKKNSDPVNLTALCVSCNAKVNENRKHWTAVFQAMAIARDIAALKERKSG